jgi:hypothetical protein
VLRCKGEFSTTEFFFILFEYSAWLIHKNVTVDYQRKSALEQIKLQMEL